MAEQKKQNLTKRSEREHPVLSEDSPLNRHILKASGLPDVKSLLIALAHDMTDDDINKLAEKAGGHQAHTNRIKHLREHAAKTHGHVRSVPLEDEEEGDGSYPDKRHRKTLEQFMTQKTGSREDGGTGQYLYPTSKSLRVLDNLYKKFLGNQRPGEQQGELGHTNPITAGAAIHDVSTSPTGRQVKAPSDVAHSSSVPAGTYGALSPGPAAARQWKELSEPGHRDAPFHINGAGLMDVGPGPERFNPTLQFDPNNDHHVAVHQTLSQHGHEFTGEHMAPENMGAHILFQDLLPDPHDPTKSMGDNREERNHMARRISELHGGITPLEARRVLDDMHHQAHDQFETHPMHYMDHLTVPEIHRVQEKDPETGELKTVEKRVMTNPVQYKEHDPGNPDSDVYPDYNKANRPINYVNFGRVVRQWNAIPKQVRDQTRRWYDTDAHEFIKDLARAGNVPYVKAASVLALMNNSMGWEMGSSGAAQYILGHDLGLKYKSASTSQVQDDDGNWTKVTAVPGSPKTIQPIYTSTRKQIQNILDAPNDDIHEIMGRARDALSSEKLGNFFMDMINAAPWHTNTNDRHMMGVQGLLDPSTLEHKEGADSDHHYAWRNMHAVANYLGVPPREVQAAVWVAYRQRKGEHTAGAANEDWGPAREAVDQGMLEQARKRDQGRVAGMGPGLEERKVQTLINERKKREAKRDAIMGIQRDPEWVKQQVAAHKESGAPVPPPETNVADPNNPERGRWTPQQELTAQIRQDWATKRKDQAKIQATKTRQETAQLKEGAKLAEGVSKYARDLTKDERKTKSDQEKATKKDNAALTREHKKKGVEEQIKNLVAALTRMQYTNRRNPKRKKPETPPPLPSVVNSPEYSLKQSFSESMLFDAAVKLAKSWESYLEYESCPKEPLTFLILRK